MSKKKRLTRMLPALVIMVLLLVNTASIYVSAALGETEKEFDTSGNPKIVGSSGTIEVFYTNIYPDEPSILTVEASSVESGYSNFYEEAEPNVFVTKDSTTGEIVQPIGTEWKWNLDAGTYYIHVEMSAPQGKKVGAKGKWKLEDAVKKPEKFESIAAELKATTEDTYEVHVNYGEYNGEDTSRVLSFCEYESTGQFFECLTSSVTIAPATTCTIYVIKTNVLKEKMPELLEISSDYIIDDATRTKLKEIAAHVTVTTPDPKLVEVINLKNEKGLREARLSWDVKRTEMGGIDGRVTGYVIKRYDETGKEVLETLYYNHEEPPIMPVTPGAYIPYDGTSLLTITPYLNYKNKQYFGSETKPIACKSAKLKPVYIRATKISKSWARVTITSYDGADGFALYQKNGKKWKKIKETKQKADIKAYNIKGKGAGTKQYKVKGFINDQGKKHYSEFRKEVKPGKNEYVWNYSNNPSSYDKLEHYFRMDKIYYSGNKLKVKCKFINTHLYYLKNFKVKVIIYCQGKKIGTVKVSSGRVNSMSIKKKTVTVPKGKKNFDLRYGETQISSITLSVKS